MLGRPQSAKIDLLKTVPLFSGLSKRHLILVAKAADETTVAEGETLAQQGKLAREFALILDGRVRVERDGKRLAWLGAGDFFGEMSIIDGQPRSATVVAETATALLVIETRAFSALLDTTPGLQRKIMVGLCERLRAADAALASVN